MGPLLLVPPIGLAYEQPEGKEGQWAILERPAPQGRAGQRRVGRDLHGQTSLRNLACLPFLLHSQKY